MLEICTLSLTGPVLGMSEWCNAVILSSMTRFQLSSMSKVVVVVVVYMFNMRSQGRIVSLSLYAIVASGECAIDHEWACMPCNCEMDMVTTLGICLAIWLEKTIYVYNYIMFSKTVHNMYTHVVELIHTW